MGHLSERRNIEGLPRRYLPLIARGQTRELPSGVRPQQRRQNFNTTPLGNDREKAVSIFNRKVEWHKAIVSGTTMEDDAD